MTRRAPEAVDVPTRGRPEEAVAALVAARMAPGGVYSASVMHDAGCACLAGKPLRACGCEVVRVTWRRVA